MDIVNTTPAVVSTVLTDNPELGQWIVLVTAKVSFVMEKDGSIAIDREDPFSLFDQDVATELGLLPRDNLPRWDNAFEVILLGKAHTPANQPLTQMEVAFSIADCRRRLRVFGDRAWEGKGANTRITSPRPFREMPLTYERAFGGSCEVLIDRESPIDIMDPNNPVGRGFDPEPAMAQLGTLLKAPKGYPKYEGWRLLPNVEDPSVLITTWDDAPQPASWATVPLSTALHMNRAITLKEGETPTFEDPPFTPALFHRAHPNCVIPLPKPDAMVKLEGVTPGKALSFMLPQIRVLADYVFGEDTGTLPLAPHMLLLLPEDRRMYIVFRARMYTNIIKGEERSLRIRLEKGWHTPTEG